MRKIIITNNESGQRLDRFLKKYLNKAPNSFIFKMIRKKNIELNRKKAKPEEILKEGDQVFLFLSADTIDKFRDTKTFHSDLKLDIVYEDSNIILMNKDIGVLSHSSQQGEDNLVDGMINYLISSGSYKPDEEKTFIPSIINRLDRNTSGIVIGCKNYESLRYMNKAMRQGKIRRFYYTLVAGKLEINRRLEAYLIKDEAHNKVTISEERLNGSKKIVTRIETKKLGKNLSLLEVELITGRSHQIRAHLSSLGYPVIGDTKYGVKNLNDYFYLNYSLKSQFLHSNRVIFTDLDKDFEYLEGKEFTCALSEKYKKIVESELR